MKCVWCRRVVEAYTCKKCGMGFKGVCDTCHYSLKHSRLTDEEKKRKFPAAYSREGCGKVDPVYHGKAWEEDPSPAQEDAIRHMEEDQYRDRG